MLEEKTKVRLEGVDLKTPVGAKRLGLVRKMLEAGDRALFLETDDLPFLPDAVAVLDREGETIGYLPPATAREIRDAVLAIEEDPEEEAGATLVSADDGEIWVEIDPDAFPEYEEIFEPDAQDQNAKKDSKKKNPAGYALIAIIAFYLAYRLFTKSGG